MQQALQIQEQNTLIVLITTVLWCEHALITIWLDLDTKQPGLG